MDKSLVGGLKSVRHPCDKQKLWCHVAGNTFHKTESYSEFCGQHSDEANTFTSYESIGSTGEAAVIRMSPRS